MNLKPGGDLASIDGSHDGVRTRASPKLIITPKRIELALRLANYCRGNASRFRWVGQFEAPQWRVGFKLAWGVKNG